MPNMTIKDFGNNPPKNADDIIQAVNNLILHHEESVFWSGNHAKTDQWEQELIYCCVRGDRTEPLQNVPWPEY